MTEPVDWPAYYRHNRRRAWECIKRGDFRNARMYLHHNRQLRRIDRLIAKRKENTL